MVSQASQHLRRVFKITDKVRKSARGDSQISTVHIVGAVTGRGYCGSRSDAGFQTTISDMNEKHRKCPYTGTIPV